jgi:hypothetical protein
MRLRSPTRERRNTVSSACEVKRTVGPDWARPSLAWLGVPLNSSLTLQRRGNALAGSRTCGPSGLLRILGRGCELLCQLPMIILHISDPPAVQRAKPRRSPPKAPPEAPGAPPRAEHRRRTAPACPEDSSRGSPPSHAPRFSALALSPCPTVPSHHQPSRNAGPGPSVACGIACPRRHRGSSERRASDRSTPGASSAWTRVPGTQCSSGTPRTWSRWHGRGTSGSTSRVTPGTSGRGTSTSGPRRAASRWQSS